MQHPRVTFLYLALEPQVRLIYRHPQGTALIHPFFLTLYLCPSETNNTILRRLILKIHHIYEQACISSAVVITVDGLGTSKFPDTGRTTPFAIHQTNFQIVSVDENG